MTTVAHELIAIAFFIVVGWVALWPARRALGAPAYHLAALPTGLLASPLAGVVSTVTGRPLDVISAVAGGVLLVAALWATQRATLGREARGTASVSPRTFAIAAAAAGTLGTVFGVARYTAANFDSIAAFWPLGVQLSRTGEFSVRLISSRSPMIPTMSAIHATFGSDWAYVVYPMLGATLALWLGMTLLAGPLSALRGKTRTLIAGGAVLFLVIEPAFLFHSFFVHSHMLSAIFLLMSLTSMWMATRPGESRSEGDAGSAYLVLAGVFAAGLALTRPDGLAYQFVPVAVAIALLTVSRVRWRSVAAFFGPMLFIVFASYGAAYVKLGMWPSTKLSGRTALVILAVLALSAAGPWIVSALDRVLPFRVAGERFLSVLVSAAALLMLGVFALKWESASGALATTRINLFEGAGGYGYLWYAVVILLVITLLTRDALRPGSWTRSPFLAIALFFVIAGLVHGTSHEGRIGVGDSLNRIVFHAVPVIVWYVGAVVARIVARPQPVDVATD